MSNRTLSPLDRIAGGIVLTEDGLAPATIMLSAGTIASVGDAGGSSAGRTIDARGMLVLPGIVDVHGDAFERQLQPRPGIAFPTALALVETERQLLASGVTTAFHGITLSWEPGLRSAATGGPCSTGSPPARGPATCACTCDGRPTISMRSRWPRPISPLGACI
jgi:hypothetical protein